ncbi:MAG: hypothetical protein A2086_16190 [Spirochaetes bacterium GWD1_27_9]|nr:MAG: hypothetical protein A2Z98_13610 [Spirochaetes bacterium GWB1_27_13]OHD27603.1 MAG: hypothetical protein A2Y34_18250 [Spirochaetes bacterium GWC1_27_15]OHD38268.1 MAG: hypothetical protein A2086_16190 [Spirochaetes bacterium GWD1_27_9]
MAHDNLQEYALANEAGYFVLFEKTKSIFLKDDLTIGNLETPVCDTIPIKGFPQFNAKTSLVTAIKNAGVDVVSLANNHSYDQRDIGVTSTIEAVKKEGLIYSGTGFTPEIARKPVIFSKNGVIFGFFSATFSINGINIIEEEDKPYVNLVPMENEKRLENFCKIIAETKKTVDFMIVAYHCGTEYTNTPIEIQEKALKKIAESGADLVLAHHPHVLEKIEYFKTLDKRNVLIAYSLGNFISAQARYLPKLKNNNQIYDSVLSKTAEGIILQLDVVKWDNNLNIVNPRIIPIFNISFRTEQNKKMYQGFQTTLIEDILKDDFTDSRFESNIPDIKKLVTYRFEKIKKLIDLPVVYENK